MGWGWRWGEGEGGTIRLKGDAISFAYKCFPKTFACGSEESNSPHIPSVEVPKLKTIYGSYLQPAFPLGALMCNTWRTVHLIKYLRGPAVWKILNSLPK